MSIETKLVNFTARLHRATLRLALTLNAKRDVRRITKLDRKLDRANELRKAADDLHVTAMNLRERASDDEDAAHQENARNARLNIARANEFANALDDVRILNVA